MDRLGGVRADAELLSHRFRAVNFRVSADVAWRLGKGEYHAVGASFKHEAGEQNQPPEHDSSDQSNTILGCSSLAKSRTAANRAPSFSFCLTFLRA